MEIVFLVDQLAAVADANRHIAVLLAEELARQGHSITLLGPADWQGKGKTPLFEKRAFQTSSKTFKKGRIETIFFQNRLVQQMSRVYRALDTKEISVKKAVISHPIVILMTLLRRVFGFDYKARAFCKALELYAKDSALCVAFTAPYHTARALAKARISAKKVVYMLDPYALHPQENKKRATKQERQVLKKVDCVFLPPVLLQNYQKIEALKPYANKWQEAEFPLTPPQEKPLPSPFPQKAKWLLFCGRLYEGLREADYLLEMLEHLPPEFTVCLVGPNEIYLKSDRMQNFQKKLGERLCCVPAVPKEQVQAFTQHARVLVNIDNTEALFVPSKLFELFAVGMPVLNVSKLQNGPSAAYMARYPRGLSLEENAQTPKDAAEQFLTFEAELGQKSLSYEQVEDLFCLHKPEHLAKQLAAQGDTQT